MPLQTSNDYYSHTSTASTSPRSCFLYQPNLTLGFQLPISEEQIQLQHTRNTRLSRKNQRHLPNTSGGTFTDNSQQLDLVTSMVDYCRVLRDQYGTISSEALAALLDKFTFILNRLDHAKQQQQYLSIIIDIVTVLIEVHPSVLISVSQKEFFSILQTIFIRIIRHCHRPAPLQEKKLLIFRLMTTLIERFITASDDITLFPLWLTDSALLGAISDCLIKIATSQDILQGNDNNRILFKYFTRLFDIYILYQQQSNHSHKDALLQLLDPIILCVTSPHFVNTFLSLPTDARSMTMIEKFFLVKCPTFLTTYYGSRLTQTIDSLLSTMLPQYAQMLEKIVLSAHHWKRPMMRAVDHLLQMINHGAHQSPSNAKLVSGHLSLIDDVLRLVNESILYNNLHEKLSNPETSLMNTAISFLVNMISDPSILAHVKQSQVTKVFLRLTTCAYEPLVFNVYALLAYTTHEEDIKAMPNPGRLLATMIQSLETALDEKRGKTNQIEQLLEALKGLVQHDQIKDEIIKQNTLPFLLQCTKRLVNRAFVLVFEILWCLTFVEEIAQTLRGDSEFLTRIQIVSQDNSNEPLKKAADGLVWKLIQEPASLEKLAKEAGIEKIIATRRIAIEQNGTEHIVKATKRGSIVSTERTFQYDIMISYCHADKELTYRIHKFLIDEGFKVWIDLDNMYGPAMSAMAEAVENSEFVMMCMSDSYKQSTYCQAEAEYAFNCKRRLIPLIMRPGYRPDGWLGLMIGSRIYVDFGRFDFETACEKLITEISLQRRQATLSVLIDPLGHQNPIDTRSAVTQAAKRDTNRTVTHQPEKLPIKKDIISLVIKARKEKLDFIRKPIHQWMEADVSDFLLANRLNQLIPLCEGMNGRALIQLYKICTSRRLRAYTVLKDELRLKSKSILNLSVYSQFLSVTEEALKSQPRTNNPSQMTRNNPPQMSTNIPFIPAPSQDASYDFSIITDASPLDTLRMVESFGSQLQRLDYFHR